MATKEWTISNDAGDWVCSVKLTKPTRWQRFKAFTSGFFSDYPPWLMRLFITAWLFVWIIFTLGAFWSHPWWVKVLDVLVLWSGIWAAWSLHRTIKNAAHVDELADTCSEQHEAVESYATIIEAQTARIAELEATVKEREGAVRTLTFALAELKVREMKSKRKGR